MSSTRNMAAVVAAVVIVAIGIAAAATFIDDGRQDNTETQSVEYWYQVAFFGYSGGEYVQTGDYDANDYNIAVYQQGNGVFCGSCCYGNVSGTLTSDGYMLFYVEEYGEIYYFEGQIDGDIMTGVTVGKESDGSLYSMYVVYSSDPLATAGSIGMADLTGTWNLDTAEAVAEGESQQLGGNGLTVTAQTGPAFCGTLDEQLDGTVEAVEFAAVMGSEQINNNRCGVMINSDGEIGAVMTDGKAMLLQVAIRDEAFSSTAPTVIERTFSRSGTTGTVSFDVPEVTGVIWTETGTYVARSWNTIEPIFGEHTMTVEHQNGRIFSGTDYFAGMATPFAAYFCSSTEFMVFYGSPAEESQYIVLGYGAIDGNALHLAKTLRESTDLNAYLDTAQITMTAADPVMPTDITGQWYAVYATGTSVNGAVFSYSISDSFWSSGLTNYGITILEQQGNLFRGLYNNNEITGAYTDGSLSFITPIGSGDESGTEYFTGYMLNEHVFVTVEEYCYDDGTFSLWSSYYTDTPMAVVPNTTLTADTAPLGTWEVPEGGYAFWYDGENTGMLKGTGLTLSADGRFLTGTIDEEVNGEVKTKGLVGLPTPDPNTFWIFDEDGYAYLAWWSGSDLLALMSVDFFDTADTGDLLAAERVYTRNGETVGEVACPDLDGTVWSAAEGRCLYTDGTVTAANNVTVKLTHQTIDGLTNLIGGTIAIDGLAQDLEFRGYVGNTGGMIALMLTDGSYYGDLYLQEDGTMLITIAGNTGYSFEVTLTQQ